MKLNDLDAWSEVDMVEMDSDGLCKVASKGSPRRHSVNMAKKAFLEVLRHLFVGPHCMAVD